MSDAERLNLLRVLPGLRALDDRALRGLISFTDEVVMAAGSCIAVEGTPCHQLIVVAEGRLAARSGECTRPLGPGESLGWNAMETRGLNEATVVAVSEARLLVVSHAQFRAMSAAVPAKSSFLAWALPASRRPLPRRPHLERA